MWIVSFDVAHKSLGVCIAECTMHASPVLEMVASAILEKNAKRARELLQGPQHVQLFVFDLLKNTKLENTTLVQRSKALVDVMKTIEPVLPQEYQVLVEYQMSANDKSRLLSAQIVYHFVHLGKPVEIVGPSLKQSINFGKTSFRDFISTHRSNYNANKAHSRFVLEAWCRQFCPEAIHNIRRANLDDAGDAFLMMISWFSKESAKKKQYFLAMI